MYSVYCIDLNLQNLGAWNPDGRVLNGYLEFSHFVENGINIDRFAVDNNVAKLSY